MDKVVVRMKYCRGDSCQQGRMPCQTPQACEVAEEDIPPAIDWVGLGLAAFVIVIFWGMIWVISR